MTKRETVFSKDIENKKLYIERAFDASLENVWKAWTESEILDQWWAPKPYKAETKAMDFKEGGSRLYCMAGPSGDRSWCIESYKTIKFHELIINSAAFCDDEGNLNTDFPVMDWEKKFSTTGNETTVNVELTFDREADLEMIIKMGFREGFMAGLDNLDDYLNAK